MRRRPTALLTRIVRAAAVPVLVAAAVLTAAAPAQAASLTQVTGFGNNPGNLTMYAYRPDGLPSNAPLVVALHGCTQDANGYYTNSGWKKFADQWKFAVVFPQTSAANAANACFNWFLTGDTARGQGEPASIKQMIDYSVANYGTNPARVFVTGLSAGGAMSAAMLATYPDVFAAGSIAAGLPYRCATSQVNAYTCMYGPVSKTPQQWGDLVRAGYSGYTGPRPRVSIWHGRSDAVVVPANGTELRDQFTNVAGVSQTPTSTSSLPAGTTMEVYGNDAVRLYQVANMGHGTPVDPGTGADQCGTAAAYFLDTICSAYRDALFFGLDGGSSGPGNPGEPGAPATPAGLAVTGTTASAASLSWGAASGASGYHVYRNGSRVTTTALGGTGYTDSGLTAGTTYSYAVSAVNSAGTESARSAPVSATTTGGTTPPVCVTATNYAHVQAGRAYQSGGYAYANGSAQRMGLYNTFYTSALKQTGPNYWVIGC
ncbi:PHB depolymerase family esterase [Micromonospora sp. NBC_01699]|uniref:extracellular catalytic domain type 1 short-chain-length polyhydroxyalkanoate depolymerase n=1 Tax=Micromonospora sp. NBC_01699 TaxID=2975984 RepID=UPI002E2C40F5|nr:PHB depolymerase family esterase [Micromonospora sp. NBC_01699]